jgi:hypothetical protein
MSDTTRDPFEWMREYERTWLKANRIIADSVSVVPLGGGWYRIDVNGRNGTAKHRKFDILEFTARLERRIAGDEA